MYKRQKSIKCRKRLLLSQVKCIFALKESFFDRGKRKQNIVIRSFLKDVYKRQDIDLPRQFLAARSQGKLAVNNSLCLYDGDVYKRQILEQVHPLENHADLFHQFGERYIPNICTCLLYTSCTTVPNAVCVNLQSFTAGTCLSRPE